MARLNGKGPEDKGSSTGRSLGNCSKDPRSSSIEYKFGQGMGKRRKAGMNENRNSQNN